MSCVMCPWYPLRRTKTPQGRCHLLEAEASRRRHLVVQAFTSVQPPRRGSQRGDGICTAGKPARALHPGPGFLARVFLKTLATRRWRSVVLMYSYSRKKKDRTTNAAPPGPDTRSTAARQTPSSHLFGQCTRLGHAHASGQPLSHVAATGGTYSR